MIGPIVAVGSVIWVIGLLVDMQEPLNQVHHIKDVRTPLATEIFDMHGEKIGEFAEERRYHIDLVDLPEYVKDAFLCAEDQSFYRHHGLNLLAVLRALWTNLRHGGIRQGASTITQQLARMYFLDQERSLDRKIKEAALAIALERSLNKGEILELYLNKVFLGHRSYGVEAAARNYFRKSARELTIGEAALLAGIPKSPSRYAPNKNSKRAFRRQKWVLERMLIHGKISRLTMEQELARYPNINRKVEDHWEKAPFFVNAVKREFLRKFEDQGFASQGLRINTTLDSPLQTAIATRLKPMMVQFNMRRDLMRSLSDEEIANIDHIESAVVGIDPTTGAVRALQGGEDYSRSQFDRTAYAKRALGGLVIPLYVAVALEKGMTPLSLTTEDMDPQPKPSGLPQGPSKGRETQAQTIYNLLIEGNKAGVDPLSLALGFGTVKDKSQRLGIDLGFDGQSKGLKEGLYNPARATPFEVARAFSAFANGGRFVAPYLIRSVQNSSGREIYRVPEISSDLTPIFDTPVANLVRQLMNLPVNYGYAKVLKDIAPNMAVVAASSDDCKNSWVVDLQDKLVGVLWMGAERETLALGNNVEQARGKALMLWREILLAAPQRYQTHQDQHREFDFVEVSRDGGKILKIPMTSQRQVSQKVSNKYPPVTKNVSR